MSQPDTPISPKFLLYSKNKESHMRIIKAGAADAAYNKKSVIGKKLLSAEPVEVVHLEVGPGDTLPSHKTPVDVFFYVLEGKGEIEIGDERAAVERDMLIESPKNIPHAVHNTSDGPFRVLVVKTPKP
jgi:mannose-6-phosphate isomerase-like protein (cupin superfamily)